MADVPTIARLFSEAAELLRAEFEYVRKTNPHPGEKGAEVEEVLKDFLNQHLPQRFRAGSGKVIDVANSLSLQQDVIVYDALSSPLYRYADRMQIVPMDAVAAVVEVKSTLDKGELEDAYRKIASCKALQKRPISDEQRQHLPGGLSEGTMGIVFGFRAGASLKALAENVVELNRQYESHLWPEMIVVLDEGVISYAIQYPGATGFPGGLMILAPPPGNKVSPPAWFVHVVMHRDQQFALNRFFLMLVTHLQFYPGHYASPPFDKMLEGAAKEVMTAGGYQFDLNSQLKPVPERLHITPDNNPTISLSIDLATKLGQKVAVLQFIPWQDGGVIRSFGAPTLARLVGLLQLPGKPMIVNDPSQPGMEITSVLPMTDSDFKRFARLIEKHTTFNAKLSST